MTRTFAPPSPSAMDGFLGIEERVPLRPDEFIAAPTRRLFAWWRDRMITGLPHWADLDPGLLEAIEPHLAVVAVAPDRTFEVQMLGEELAATVEPGRAHSRITAVDPIENRRRLHDHYGWIARNRLPLRCTGPLTFVGRPDRTFEALDVPLAGADGRVHRIVGALVPLA